MRVVNAAKLPRIMGNTNHRTIENIHQFIHVSNGGGKPCLSCWKSDGALTPWKGVMALARMKVTCRLCNTEFENPSSLAGHERQPMAAVPSAHAEVISLGKSGGTAFN
jgi:hypothetical protein